MPVPNTFATATTSIPLSQLDANFATAITIGNTAVQLGNTITTINNTTLANTTISSGNATVTKITTPTVDAGSGTALSLQSNSTTGLYMDTSQNVGIGGAPIAGGKLDVFGAGVQRFYMRETGSTVYGKLAVNTSNFQVGTETNHALIFNTNDSERMRIDSSGNLLVGTTSAGVGASTGFRVVGTTSVADRAELGSTATTNTTVGWSMWSTGAAAYRFYVGYGGTIYATSTTITAISDQRLKENIQDIDVGLNAIMALKPRKFDWKQGKGKDKKGDRGWIAQEFEQVFPEMVESWQGDVPDGEEPYKAVNADLIPILVAAMQEQQKLIQELSAEVTALKAKVGA